MWEPLAPRGAGGEPGPGHPMIPAPYRDLVQQHGMCLQNSLDSVPQAYLPPAGDGGWHLQ